MSAREVLQSPFHRWRGAVLLSVLNALALYGLYRVRYAAYRSGRAEHDPEVLWAVICGLSLTVAVLIIISQAATILRGREFYKAIGALASMVAMVALLGLLAYVPLDAVAHRHAVETALRSTEYSFASGAVAVLLAVHLFFVFAFFGHNLLSYVLHGQRKGDLSIIRTDRTASGQ